MGLVLGLLGGGGSILAVPILVYVLGVEAHAAVSFSLILVGGTALVGAFLHQEAARVAWKQGLLFVCFGAPLNFVGAALSQHVSAMVLLLLFGVLMGISGTAMLFKRSERQNSTDERSIWPLVFAGGMVGFLAGFLGVGGGFLIVPSLVLFLQIPIKSATGTALLIIAINSALALIGHRHSLLVNWTLLLELMVPGFANDVRRRQIDGETQRATDSQSIQRVRHSVGSGHGCDQHGPHVQTLGKKAARRAAARLHLS